jgi:ABC-type branched-subunit amino acid transport system ATPase component
MRQQLAAGEFQRARRIAGGRADRGRRPGLVHRSRAGMLRPSGGSVMVAGTEVSRTAPFRRSRLGVCLIPEGRGIFRSLTVRENLELQIPPWRRDEAIDAAIEAFPVLGQRLQQAAGSLSSGQQQMLALSRAYLAAPKVVLLDEVSLGLAPAASLDQDALVNAYLGHSDDIPA